MAPIIIVGTGLAGYGAARALRRVDTGTPLVIVSADGGEFYTKPALSEAFGTGRTPATLPNGAAEAMAAQLKAIVRARTRVTAVEPQAHRVRIGDEALEYSRLVLAVGANQVRVPLAGSAADRVVTVNSLDDYARFRALVAGKHSVAIIGAGLIGCEFANDLTGAGFKVELIDVAAQPLPRLLPPEAAAMLRDRLGAAGVGWHLGTSVAAVDGDGDALAVTLAGGTVLRADIVLSAIGLRPETTLARAAGIDVGRGIAVDRYLRSSAPDVYALGDCAEVQGLVLPFVMPIGHASRALAGTLSGKPAPVEYPAMPVLVKTRVCPAIVSPPAAGAAGEWRVTREEDGVKALFVDAGGRLLGYALVGAAAGERARLTPQLPPVLAAA
ncbi:MAG: FAD-dependent oxidoreductase [Burkholderiales bacterium]|nr:FAD-dependent oxidoreductase [Burkholderiales bacterium]